MKNHPHLIVLNQKVNTDTKSPTNSTSAVIPNQLYHLRNNSNPDPQKPVKTYVALIDNYEKVSFVSVMYVLPNPVAFFISFE